MLTILTVFILTFLNLWFQPENSRFEVRDCSPERPDMRSGFHAAKILPVGVRGTKNIWCLSSLFSISYFCTRIESNKHGIFAITRINRPLQDSLGFWIPRGGFQISGTCTGFRISCQWNLDSGFRIPSAEFQIPRLPGFGKPDYLKWGKRAHLSVASGVV